MFLSSCSPLWFLCVFAFSLLFFSVLVPPSILGAVAAEDGALKLLLLEATKTVVTLVVTLVYCSPWFSLCVSSAQDINDGDEDVRCCQLNGRLPPLCFFVCFSALYSVALRLP
ncbi:hypothetical protein NC652_017331 [Populus alba x Populus x berolinensis]|nr:hypothetical protein NC652_017331 [Populus alba x Populus x berolinensis]